MRCCQTYDLKEAKIDDRRLEYDFGVGNVVLQDKGLVVRWGRRVKITMREGSH